nr:MAG TPA: hypothetical protein [Bacteriophage sp.]
MERPTNRRILWLIKHRQQKNCLHQKQERKEFNGQLGR